MAQVRITRFRPTMRDPMDKRVEVLENEVMKLQDELRFVLTHLDDKNFTPEQWAALNKAGGEDSGNAE